MGTREMVEVMSDWLAIEVYHERYYFTSEIKAYKDESLDVVISDCGYDENFIEGDAKEGVYLIDATHRRPIGDYEYETGRVQGVEHITPKALIILDLNKIHTYDYHEIVFGKTNTKFGLLDIKEDK